MTLQSVELFMEYEPGAYVRDVCPTPLLIVVALEDTLTPAEFACEAFERALHPKKLVTLPGGHFGAYVGRNFEISSASQRDWFVEHLRP